MLQVSRQGMNTTSHDTNIEQIRKSEERVRTVLNSFHIPYPITSSSYHCIHFHNSVADILGIDGFPDISKRVRF